MQSHNTCHAEHKYDVAYDVLEKNHYLFFSQCRLSLLWNCVYLFKTKMLSSVFLGSFESLQERTTDEASAKTGISPNPKISALRAPIPGHFLSWVRIYSCQIVTALQGYLHALKVSVHRHAGTFRTSFRFKRDLSEMIEEPCQAKICMLYKKCTTTHAVWNRNKASKTEPLLKH